MNTKHYLVISGIVGGVIGSLLTALLVSPVTAQRDNFDTIQCSRLEVVDAEGRLKVVLDGNGHSGYVATFGNDRILRVVLAHTEDGGSVEVHAKGADKGMAIMGVNSHGDGYVSTWEKNGYRQ